jgi:phage shock protein C
MDVDVTLIRLAWVVLSIVPGSIVGGVAAYIVAWMVMPQATQPAGTSANRKWLSRSTTDRKIAGVCGGIGEYFSVDSTVVRVAWAFLSVVPGCFIGGLVAYLLAWFIIPERTTVTTVPAPTVA